MPRLKTLILIILVTALSFALIGCNLLAGRSTGPEEITGQSGELPGWLLLSHRSAESPGSNNNGILNPKELDDEEDDEDNNNDSVAESYEAEKQTGSSTSGSSGSSEPAPSAPSAPSTPGSVTDMPFQGGTYTGAVNSDGSPDGYGVWNGPGGITYTGAWKDGQPHGQGTMTNSAGGEKSGKWVNGEIVEESTDWFDTSGNRNDGITWDSN